MLGAQEVSAAPLAWDGSLPGAPRLTADFFLAGSGHTAMALDVSWVGWRSPVAPHG